VSGLDESQRRFLSRLRDPTLQGVGPAPRYQGEWEHWPVYASLLALGYIRGEKLPEGEYEGPICQWGWDSGKKIKINQQELPFVVTHRYFLTEAGRAALAEEER